MNAKIDADEGVTAYQWGAEQSGLSGDTHTLRPPDGPDSETAGQEDARSALKTALKAAGRAAEATARGAKRRHRGWTNDRANEDDHELRRIAYRLQKYEEWAPARGLPGL